MAERFAWTCPFCNHDAMIHPNSPDYYRVSGHIGTTKYGDQMVIAVAIICPNPECQEYTLSAGIWGAVHNQSVGRYQSTGESHRKWQLVPSSEAKVFPDYIPQVILDDYYEACLIKNLSPKASATLSRRCLQGMIRDYWGIAKRRLKDEIGALQEKVDPLMWQAIDAVREIGNIGAHMEKDVNIIIDVEPEEAGQLLGLIEMLVHDWYIVRYERQKQLKAMRALAEAKNQAKNQSPVEEGTPDPSQKP